MVTPDDIVTHELKLRLRNSPMITHPLSTAVPQFVNQRLIARGIQTPRPEVDSVVLQNGGIMGADVFDVLGQSAARNAAATEIIAKFSDSTVSDATLQEWLQAQQSMLAKQNAYLGQVS